MWLEILFLNPIAWVMWVIIGGSFYLGYIGIVRLTLF